MPTPTGRRCKGVCAKTPQFNPLLFIPDANDLKERELEQVWQRDVPRVTNVVVWSGRLGVWGADAGEKAD